jgi:hypothetical protein
VFLFSRLSSLSSSSATSKPLPPSADILNEHQRLRAFLPYFRKCAQISIAGLGLFTWQPHESYKDNLTVVLVKVKGERDEKKDDEREVKSREKEAEVEYEEGENERALEKQ